MAAGGEAGVDTAKRVHRVRDVLVRVRRRERQGEHLLPGPLRDGKRRLFGEVLAVIRERVHREEMDAGADVLVGERTLVGVAVGARVLGIDADDVQVERVPVARIARQRRDPRQVGHGCVVGLDVAAADLGVHIDLVELAERDRREDV
jgi:hypothetical protein